MNVMFGMLFISNYVTLEYKDSIYIFLNNTFIYLNNLSTLLDCCYDFLHFHSGISDLTHYSSIEINIINHFS
jgi:hypothetical protein